LQHFHNKLCHIVCTLLTNAISVDMTVQMLTHPSIIVDVSVVNHSQVVDAQGTKVIRAAGLLFVIIVIVVVVYGAIAVAVALALTIDFNNFATVSIIDIKRNWGAVVILLLLAPGQRPSGQQSERLALAANAIAATANGHIIRASC
jgi:hypothetical protein